MKIGKGRRAQSAGGSAGLKPGKPSKNQTKKSLYIVVTVVITALLIVWVYSMGRKAEETVQVCMTSQAIYKNQVITESMLQPYDMLKGEFEKFAITESNGTKTRRILLWEERGMILNSFAAYPIQANEYCEYRDFIRSRVDNEDNVLYSFPGKNIVQLSIGTADLSSFKTFLQPGDRVNISAIYSESEAVVQTDAFGGQTTQNVETFKTERVFNDIMIADLLNSSGESILDIYADSFKTFLQPGDRVNISAIYSESEAVVQTDAFGGQTTQNVETFKTERVFNDIMIADLLNSSGESILDIYADYNNRTTYQQAQLDASQSFKDSVEPATLLVALTPQEEERYYYYASKGDVEFVMSLPQRVE